MDEPRWVDVEVDVDDERDGVDVREVLVLRPSLSIDLIDVRDVPDVLTRDVIVVLVREGAAVLFVVVVVVDELVVPDVRVDVPEVFVLVEVVVVDVLVELDELDELEEVEVPEVRLEVPVVELDEAAEVEVPEVRLEVPVVELDDEDEVVVRDELAAAVSRSSAALRTTR